jgi:hypothetical protein
LFIGGINLSFRTREEEVVSARQERVEIFLRLEVEALETPQLIEQTPPDNQNVFVRRAHEFVILIPQSREKNL